MPVGRARHPYFAAIVAVGAVGEIAIASNPGSVPSANPLQLHGTDSPGWRHAIGSPISAEEAPGVAGVKSCPPPSFDY